MAYKNKYRIYSIILVNHGRQLRTICSEPTEEKIYKRLETLLKENKKVMFPMRYNVQIHEMLDAEYELVIIKCRDDIEDKTTKVRDASGEFTNYETNNEDWIVIDRAHYDIEETFWVYGYHPRLQRKTFKWVFDNFISKNAKDEYSFKTVQVLYNKVLIECDGKLEMVICKNKSDSVRMYNLIEQMASKKKYKYIAFMGDITKSKYKKQWVQKIKDLTGWDTKKVLRQSTRD
jgi:hypothetical protein